MKRQSLKKMLKNRALKNIKSTRTTKTYKHAITSFNDWAKRNGITRYEQVTQEVIQRYADYMVKKGYSPSTIHTRLAPVCKAIGIKQNVIKKPARTADKITRSRTCWKNEQGIKERTSPKYARCVMAQEIIGCRRAELARIRIKDILRKDEHGHTDFVRDESGYPCVHIAQGKGGKEQLQRIDPQDLPFLKELLRTAEDLRPDTRLLSWTEMNNKLDLHGIRGEHARDMYDLYLERLKSDPGYRDQLKQELIKRYDAFNNPNRKGAKAHRDHYLRELNNPNPYILRGANRELAEANRRPIKYDRTALLAVSVFHLSHWRIDVTITYLTGR